MRVCAMLFTFMAKVMLIDDDAFFLRVHSDLLSRLGYELQTYQSPVEALGADWHDVMAVVCDLEMPGMRGTELLAAVRESGATAAPFLFLTAHDPDDSMLATAVRYSADYLPKGTSTRELATWLASKVQG